MGSSSSRSSRSSSRPIIIARRWNFEKSDTVRVSSHSSSTHHKQCSTQETPTPNANSSFLSMSPTDSHRRRRSPNAVVRAPETVPPPAYSPSPPPGSMPSTLSSPGVVSSSTTDAGARMSSYGSSYTSIYSIAPDSSPTSSSSRATRTNSYLRAPMSQQTKEDALETLRKFNTVIIVDDSGSMQGEQWTEATKALASLAALAGKYDTDGIDIYFLNDRAVGTNLKHEAQVEALFTQVRPYGITPIGERLEDLLRDYLFQIESVYSDGGPAALKVIKPVNYIVITDGIPTDDPESVIVQAAKRLDAGNFPLSQVGIQFVQIGSSRKATRFLQELDDALSDKHHIRDIVDTTPYTGTLNSDTLIKILLGGINRRVDAGGAQAVTL